LDLFLVGSSDGFESNECEDPVKGDWPGQADVDREAVQSFGIIGWTRSRWVGSFLIYG